MEDMIGREIGNYRIEAKIGEGGMGTVYRGVEISLDRPVAIKVLNGDLARNPDVVERFRSEARAQANLNHTNVATLYTFLALASDAMMVMEYVDGETFQQMVNRGGAMDSRQAVPLLKQALAGIGAAHRMGIIHRDIKPANLMLNKTGIVKAMDFGIARVTGDRRLTRTGVQVGTLYYMSPEQVKGGRLDTRSDIYSLGVTLYEMLTAHVPFAGDSDFQILTAHVIAPPPPPTTFCPSIPKGIENIILKSLEKNPDQRFQTVEEFAAALDHPELWENYVPAPAFPDPASFQPPVPAIPKPAPSPRPRWLIPVVAAGLLVTLMAAGAVVAYELWPRAKKKEPVAAATYRASAPVESPGTGVAAPTEPPAKDQAAETETNPLPPPQPAEPATQPKSVSSPRPRSHAPPIGTPVASPNSEPIIQTPIEAPTPAPAPVAQRLVIPGSTQLRIRTTAPIDGAKAQPGQTFAASLEAPVSVGGRVALPQHADALVRLVEAHQGGHFHGAPRLLLTLDSVTVQGQRYRVQTAPIDVAGGAHGGHSGVFGTIGGAVGGAAVGVAREAKGATKDALAVAGAGSGNSTATGDKALFLPPQSHLTFESLAPLTVTVQ